MRGLFLAKTLSGSEINSLHIFLSPSICYNSRPCWTASGSGSAHPLASFAHAKACSFRIWRFGSSSPSWSADDQKFHLACAPACHWNACEPNPALGSLSQAASSANLCRSAGKAYQPVGRGPVILLCSIALPASHRIRRSPRACAFTKLIRPDPRAHGQVRPIG